MIFTRALADELIPFSINFNEDGEISGLSRLLFQVWKIKENDDLIAVRQRLQISRPFAGDLQHAYLNELSGMIIHLHLGGHLPPLIAQSRQWW